MCAAISSTSFSQSLLEALLQSHKVFLFFKKCKHLFYGLKFGMFGLGRFFLVKALLH